MKRHSLQGMVLGKCTARTEKIYKLKFASEIQIMKKKKLMTRSQNMARVKSKNTKPEIVLRKLLWHMEFRYRVNYKELPGSPDLYIPKHRVAIFVNGCFWYMHEKCRYSSIPKSNYEFRKINSKEMLKGTRKIMLSLKVWELK